MGPEDLILESVRCLAGAWTAFGSRFPGGRVDRLDGVSVFWADVPLSFLNLGLVDTPCADSAQLRRRLDALLEHLAEAEHPWLGCLCEEWVPSDWRDTVEAAGLHVAMPLTGMVTEHLVPPRRPPPPLSLRRVADEASRRAVAELNTMAYELEAGQCDCLAEPAFWPADIYGVVGALDGEDVSTATVLPVENTLYVGLVATKPGHGRQGYAEHVMRHSVERGGEELGLRRTLLHASEAGRPVYAAMGYEETSRFALLTTAPPEAG